MVDADDDEENLVLYCRSSKKTYTVPVTDVTPQRLGEIQEELSERLFMDQPVADDYDGDEIKSDSEPAVE